MSQKRTYSDQGVFSGKKLKTVESEADTMFSILHLTSSQVCWACDEVVDIEVCIKQDLQPHTYYNLASVLLNQSQIELYKDDDSDDMTLLRSAADLSRDKLSEVMTRLNLYIEYNTLQETIQDLEKMTNENLFHKYREITFIVKMVDYLQRNKGSELNGLVKTCQEEDVKDLLFQDVRFARLLPLLSALMDNEILADLTFDEEDEIDLSSSFSLQRVDTDEDAQLILPAPSQSIPNSPASNEPLPFIFSQPSFSAVYESPSVTTENIPNYEELSTAEIIAKVRSYGFKPASRAQMISYLEQLRHCSSQTSSPHSKSSKATADPNTTRSKIEAYLRSQEHLWTKILMYEPLDLDELYQNIDVPCKKSELQVILDECASILYVKTVIEFKN